jgi:hypothetical protein
LIAAVCHRAKLGYYWLSMRGRIFLLAVGAMALVVLLLLTRTHERDAATDSSRKQDSLNRSIGRTVEPPTSRRTRTGSRLDATPPDLSRITFHKPGPDAIPNEYILRFRTAADMQAFLERAREKGIDVLGQIAKFNAVRIRVKDREELIGLLNDAPSPSDVGNNYWVRVPETTDRDVELPQGLYAPFGNKALRWVGAEGHRHDWGKGVTVAVLDTGIADHNTFDGTRITRLDLLDADASAAGPYAGHGTAVASILAGGSPEAAGVAPSTDLLSIRVASGDGVGNGFAVATAIIEAVDRGVDIISISLGTRGDSFILGQAVTYALLNGVMIVASTGNDSVYGVSYPAAYPGVIAVTAVDANGRHLYFANRGEEVDLAAPGLGVDAAWTDGKIVSFSGTSAAVPFVSGALATLLSSSSQMTSSNAVAILLQYSNDTGEPGHDDEFGYGILDLDRALDRDQRGIYDMAMAGIVLDEAAGTLLVAAQNRGTENLFHVQLDVTLDGASHSVPFFNIEPGQVISKGYPVDMAALHAAGSIRVSASVLVRGAEDGKPYNNSRNVIVYVKK